jgi:hypothetical protein
MKKKSYARLKKDLDKIFSEYIRLKDSRHLIARCYTCGKKASYKELQAGHYVPRNYLPLRWDERNVKVQCVGCNIFKKGNLDEYAIKLRQEYGNKILETLNKEKYKLIKLSTLDLQKRIDLYREKYLAL